MILFYGALCAFADTALHEAPDRLALEATLVGHDLAPDATRLFVGRTGPAWLAGQGVLMGRRGVAIIGPHEVARAEAATTRSRVCTPVDPWARESEVVVYAGPSPEVDATTQRTFQGTPSLALAQPREGEVRWYVALGPGDSVTHTSVATPDGVAEAVRLERGETSLQLQQGKRGARACYGAQ